ncbi:MAG: anthranilate phosphoribosyltransferase family protein [Synechococcales cyanobacterium]
MSLAFREFVRKVGSGTHTHKDLSREDACQAARMMLMDEATPAQIGAFLIAHRIKRPTASELCGFLDAYGLLCPGIPDQHVDRPVRVFGYPYDGRDRTSPVAPLVALILAASGIPVVQHGAGVCPTKYGVPLVDLWQTLGVDWRGQSLTTLGTSLTQIGVAFVYVPTHFPAAQRLMAYRDEIGKRPPLATVELLWTPYGGAVHLVAGFVHPPTETLMLEVAHQLGIGDITTIKGLEGSCDLPRSRTAIVHHRGERCLLKAKDYDLEGTELAWSGPEDWGSQAHAIIRGETHVPLWPEVLWNGGVQLFLNGVTPSIASGLTQTEALITQGQVAQVLTKVQTQVHPVVVP